MAIKESKTMGKIREATIRIFPMPVLAFMLIFWKRYKKFRMPEKRYSFGDLYPDRIFYVIRLYPPASGYLSNYVYVLGYMKYAYDNGWIPIIDMKNYQNMYNDYADDVGGQDIWGWFFEQPWDNIHRRRYTLEEVYKSKNVILSCGSEDFYDASFKEDIVEWQRCMMKKVPFKPDMEKHVKEELEKAIGYRQNNKVMGIAIRETDLKRHYAGHAIQMTKSDAVKLYYELKKEWYSNSSDVVAFVNAEEEKSMEYIKKEIPGVLCMNNRRVEKYTGGNAAYASKNIDSRQKLKDYLTNMYILSKCDSLIGTLNNGFYVAYLWSDGNLAHFKKVDLGTYK